jgi:uncharacterized protein
LKRSGSTSEKAGRDADGDRLTISLADGRSVSGVWTAAGGEPLACLVYAPGAGANLSDGFGRYAARMLPPRGIGVLRFQFPYAEAGRKSPDRPPVLEATWRAAVEAARSRPGKLILGGRSMGGRIASQVVAQGENVDGLALFAYPLHPPGQPERRRDAHLPSLAVPTLFVSGTNDAFGTPEELQAAAALVPSATLHLLADADHSFRVPKRTGRNLPEVWNEAIETFVDWAATLTGRER